MCGGVGGNSGRRRCALRAALMVGDCSSDASQRTRHGRLIMLSQHLSGVFKDGIPIAFTL